MLKKKRKVLLTGLTGFIGKHTARKIHKNFDITAIIRPSSSKSKYKEFENDVNLVRISLSDRERLKTFLQNQYFDFILHIGAIRGGREYDNSEYYRANVIATDILINNAVKNNSKFIYCSTVGVYGAIPDELPATLHTPYKEDNFYHKTKIQCEKNINKAIFDGVLNACIVRPAITYGTDDFGFPYTLTKLVDKRLLYLPTKPIFIHLLNVDTLSEVFKRLLERGFTPGKIWNVADKDRVCFQVLADFIYRRLKELSILKSMPDSLKTEENFDTNNIGWDVYKPYPSNKQINKGFFDLLIKMFKISKSDHWVSRLELISNSWYYDVRAIYDDLEIKSYDTIPDFGVVVDWYAGLDNK